MAAAGVRHVQAEELLLDWQSSGDFFLYILFCRGLPFYLLLLLTLRTGRRIFFHFYFLYCGFSYGVQAVLLTIQYQLAGVPIYAAQIIPQIFFYVPALYLGYRLSEDHMDRKKWYTGKERYRLAAASFLLWTTGIVLEWYVNPFIIRTGMKIFL